MHFERAGRSAAVAAMAALLAVGCGGGGGQPVSATSSAQVAITTTTAPRVAAQSIDASNAGTVVDRQLSGGVQVDALALAPPDMAALLARLVRSARPPGAAVVAGVAIDTTAACPGGGTTRATGNLVNVEVFTAGDTVTATFNNCVEGALTLTGSVTYTIVQFDGNGVTLDLTLNGFTATQAGIGSRLDGAMRAASQVSSTGERVTMSSPALTFARLSNGSVQLSRTLNAYNYDQATDFPEVNNTTTVSYTLSGDLPVLGAVSWGVATTQPVVKASTNLRPTSGTLRVTGANGTTVTIVLSSTGAQLAIDSDGNGSVDSNLSLTWAQIDALL